MRSEAKTSPRSFFADFEYPIRARFYPLGFPLDLETNSEEVILAAKQGWGRFTQRFEEAPVRLVWEFPNTGRNAARLSRRSFPKST